LTSQISDPPNRQQLRVSQPLPEQPARFSKAGVISLLVLISLLLFLFTGLIVSSFPQIHQVSPRNQTPTATQDQDNASTPILTPNNKKIPMLQLPGGHYIIYEQQNNLYMVSTSGGLPQLLPTPGYAYSEAVRPLLTPTGQLLYAGNGLWLTDIFDGTSTQVAALAPDRMITSMAMSNDGTKVAWSTGSIVGNGSTDIYAGSLEDPRLVYQQTDADCPCFRVFSFMNDPRKQGDTTLLLTDGQGSHEGVQYGLWLLDLTVPSPVVPQPLLDENSLQGPLALAPYGNTLLYSPDEGVVPYPTDASIPIDIAALTYANSLNLATLGGQALTMSTPQVVLPGQRNLSNSAAYHWVTTPLFTPDAHTLVYVEFSSDSQAPFDRHSALYTVQISGSGAQLHPRLLATSPALLIELGAWFNDHIVTFYADGALYALDIRTGAVTTILQTATYARIIAVVGTNQILRVDIPSLQSEVGSEAYALQYS
jgi:hypothetical protein